MFKLEKELRNEIFDLNKINDKFKIKNEELENHIKKLNDLLS